MNLQFQYPWVLFLLWLVPVLGMGWHILAQRQSGSHAFVSDTMAAKLAPAPSPLRRAWQLALLMTGLALALIAAARPQWGMKDETVYQRGRDLLIALDVSRSMLARDVHPSRLGRAKADLQDLVKQLKGDRVGLLAFRGHPLLLCPLTTDYGFLAQALQGADVDSAPAGETDIGDAILACLQNLQDDEGSHKAIVLVSDGDDLAGKIPEATAKAREKGVAIFTVGFGSTEGAPVPSAVSKRDNMSFQGHDVVSKLNHEVLRELAEQTGGAYVPVGLANVKLGDLYRDHLSRISARDLEESVQRRYIERFQWFLFPAVLCFLAIAFLSRGQVMARRPPTPREKSPSPRPPPMVPPALPALMALIGLSCGIATAAETDTNAAPPVERTVKAGSVPAGREGARLAQKLYLLGKYGEAAETYQTAAQTAARANRDDFLFNAGCSFLKAGKAEEAADLFRSLTGEGGNLGAAAAYNLGCALAMQGSAPLAPDAATPPDPAVAERHAQALKQAGTAFQKALRLDPDQADSRRNLAITANLAREAAEQARIIRLMAEHGQAQPGALADMMLLQQRKLIQEIPAGFTNTSPALIAVLEGLAAEQDKTADLMIPLKGKLLQAMSQSQSSGNNTNAQQQMAMVNAFAEAIRDEMFGAAASLRNLDRAAYPSARKAGESVYTLWKGIAGYQALLREDLERQTNAIMLTQSGATSPTDELRKTVGSDQSEARDLTGLFKERFEQTVPAEGIKRPVGQTSTNQATGTNATETVLSAEDRAKIVTLAGQALTVQESASKAAATNLAVSLPHQRQAHALLREIEKLLPKEKSPQDNPQHSPQQNQDKDQKQDQQQPPPKEQPKPQKEQQKPDQKKQPMSQDDLKKLLDKARQREQEHEQEKREREATLPMSPAERDW